MTAQEKKQTTRNQVQSRLIDSGDRQDTYRAWLRTAEGRNRQGSELYRTVQKALRSAEQGGNVGEYETSSNGDRQNRGRSRSDGKQSILNDTQQFFLTLP